jgi:hypothetical protein
MDIKYIEDPKSVITIEYSRIPYGKHAEMALTKLEMAKASIIGIRLSKNKYYVLKNKFGNPRKVSKKEWDLLVNKSINSCKPETKVQ